MRGEDLNLRPSGYGLVRCDYVLYARLQQKYAKRMLGALAEHVDDATRRGKAWPATPRALSARLRRAATFLRKVGVTIGFLRQGHEKARLICIEGKSAGGGTEVGDFASAPAASSETGPKGMSRKVFLRTQVRTQSPTRPQMRTQNQRRTQTRTVSESFASALHLWKTNEIPIYGRCGRKFSPFLAVRTRLRLKMTT